MTDLATLEQRIAALEAALETGRPQAGNWLAAHNPLVFAAQSVRTRHIAKRQVQSGQAALTRYVFNTTAQVSTTSTSTWVDLVSGTITVDVVPAVIAVWGSVAIQRSAAGAVGVRLFDSTSSAMFGQSSFDIVTASKLTPTFPSLIYDVDVAGDRVLKLQMAQDAAGTLSTYDPAGLSGFIYLNVLISGRA